MKNDERWLVNYEALKVYVLETGHFPNKHDKRLNWYKYNAKLIKQGKLSPEREQMIPELEEMRSGGHTGGRRKATHDDDTAVPTMTMTEFFEEGLTPQKCAFDTSECAESHKNVGWECKKCLIRRFFLVDCEKICNFAGRKIHEYVTDT